jgi:hypothetical protein
MSAEISFIDYPLGNAKIGQTPGEEEASSSFVIDEHNHLICKQVHNKPGNNSNVHGHGYGLLTIFSYSFSTLWARVQQFGYDLFLPIGYPDSVGPNYLEYQLYDSLQGLCSYLRGVVTTSAVLKAAGVGEAQAKATSAAMVRVMALCRCHSFFNEGHTLYTRRKQYDV